MKSKLLILVALLSSVAANAAVLSTNLNMTGKTDGVFNLTTNRASVYNVQLANGNGSGVATIEFYDVASTAAPYFGTNYTVTAGNITNMISYATNYTYSFVGANGYTNWYTNSGVWTVPSTTLNGTTNRANPLLVYSVPANSVATYDASALFVNGISVRCTATTNVVTTLYYRSGQ